MLSKLKSFFQNNRVILSTLSTAIVMGVFYWYFDQNRLSLERLDSLNLFHIMAIFLLHNMMVFLMGLLNYLIIRNIDPNVSFWDTLLLQHVNNILNKIITKWGAAYRAFYLKQNYNFPYSKFLSSISGFYVINLLAQSIAGLFFFLYFYLKDQQYNWGLVFIYSILFIFSIIIISVKPSMKPVESGYKKILYNIILGWNVIVEKPKDIVVFSFISITYMFFRSIQLIIIFRAINIKTEVISIAFLSTLAIILSFINITPDGFGIREWLYLISSPLVGITGPNIVLGSLILRSITLLSSIIIGGISYIVQKYIYVPEERTRLIL